MTDVVTKVSIGGQVYPFGQVDTSVAADDVSYDNTTSGMTADNVQEAIDEVFQSVSNGKELIADAITDKGVSTSATDSFQTMVDNIESIDTHDVLYNNYVSNGLYIGTTAYDSDRNHTNFLKTCDLFDKKVVYCFTIANYDYPARGFVALINKDKTFTKLTCNRYWVVDNLSVRDVNGQDYIVYGNSSSNSYKECFRINKTTFALSVSDSSTSYSSLPGTEVTEHETLDFKITTQVVEKAMSAFIKDI